MGKTGYGVFLFHEKKSFRGETINVFNHGKMERDFTYIDDIVEGIERLIDLPPKANPEWDESQDALSESFAPYKIYNIGNNQPVTLEHFISTLEEKLGRKAKKKLYGDATRRCSTNLCGYFRFRKRYQFQTLH